jgi:hypothetical protein
MTSDRKPPSGRYVYRGSVPARSNDFQAVVYFVERHLAADAVVQESASLPDRVTGRMREVDVLITYTVGGRPILIGVECRRRSRRDAVSWVEEMRAKHDDLPTDRLVLVSASGFSASAAAKARHYNIEAVTPGQPISHDGPLAQLGDPHVEFRDLTYTDLVSLDGTVDIDGDTVQIDLIPNHVIFASDGSQIGHISDLITNALDQADARSAIANAADGDQHMAIEISRPRTDTGSGPIEVHVRNEEPQPRLLVLTSLRIVLAVRVDIRPVSLAAGQLRETTYAYGSGRVGGNEALLVFTGAGPETQLQVRFTEPDKTVSDWTADRTTQTLLPHDRD